MKNYGIYQCSVTAYKYGKKEGVSLYNVRSPHIPPFESFAKAIRTIFPAWAWEFDKGTDWDKDEDTQFIQYIAHTSCRDKSNYVIATCYAY